MHSTPPLFAELILPLAVEGCFTYAIPEEMQSQITIGQRVEVEFGKRKHYAAIVKNLTTNTHWEQPKPILSILDEEALLSTQQLQFWDWMSSYYLCSLGEIYLAALPTALRPDSETLIQSLLAEDVFPEEASEDEYLILEALALRKELRLMEVQHILQKKAVLKTLYVMLEKRWITIHEKLVDTGNVPKVSWIRLHSKWRASLDTLHVAIDSIQRSERQSRSFISYLQGHKDYGWTRRKDLQKISATPGDVTQSLLQKEIYEELLLDKFEYPSSESTLGQVSLSKEQEAVYQEICTQTKDNKPILLHGVTGSGKTIIYLKYIQEILESGKHVLFLLPEIALTAQLVQRLRVFLGDRLLEYHSDLSPKSKLAVWHMAKKSGHVFIGARSSIFLPFQNLGLIIVDEEHDASYKQNDPAPRYQARDAAVVLSKLHKCPILLGSATPCLESYHNAQEKKYHYVRLTNRFGDSTLPQIETVSLKEVPILGKKKGLFTDQLIQMIQDQFDKGKQVIIFRNRRGYSPLLQCGNCQWEAICSQCDIRLTIHKQDQKMKCHICGQSKPVPKKCPNCGQFTLRQMGFGTEQIEEALKELFPDRRMLRLDLDIARSRNMQQRIIEDFQEQEADLMVGTQMVTKGLDFEHVGLVGILQADQILFYPDFRAQERAFQLLTQVSGRAGRRADQGQVVIQGFQIHHPVIQYVLEHRTEEFYQNELRERKKFNYPPFVRLIRLQVLHRNIAVAEEAANYLAGLLKATLGKRILGPAEPHLGRIKGMYVRELLIKIEKDSNQLFAIKSMILQNIQITQSQQKFKSVRLSIDVDP